MIRAKSRTLLQEGTNVPCEIPGLMTLNPIYFTVLLVNSYFSTPERLYMIWLWACRRPPWATIYWQTNLKGRVLVPVLFPYCQKKKKKKWKIHLTPGYQSTNKKEGRVRKIPRKRKWPLIPVFLPGKFHGQRSLAGYSSWGHTKLGTAEATKHNKKYKMTSFSWLYLFRLYCIIYLFKRYYISFNHP